MSSRSRRLATVALAALFVLVAVLPVAAAGPTILASDAAAPGGRLVVVWRDSAPSSLRLSGVRSLRVAAVGQRSVVVAGPGRAGEVAAELRADPRVLGVVPDAARNAAGNVRISIDTSRVTVMVVPTDEERMVARHTSTLLGIGSSMEVGHEGAHSQG